MDIDDLLEQSEFLGASGKLNMLMYHTAGVSLVNKMECVFDDKPKARDWYFSKNHELKNERPYDLCKRQEYNKVIKALEQAETSEKINLALEELRKSNDD